jgi:hypothetical protein
MRYFVSEAIVTFYLWLWRFWVVVVFLPFALCMKVLHYLRCDIICNNKKNWQSFYYFLFVLNAIFSMKLPNNFVPDSGIIFEGSLSEGSYTLVLFVFHPFIDGWLFFILLFCSFSLLIELHLSKYSVDIKPFPYEFFTEINPHVLNFLMWSLFHLCGIYSLRKLQNTIMIDA